MSLATAFIITLTTKIALAAFAALQPQNTSLTWIFGFWLPISAMFIYITFGHFKTKKSSLDERLNYGDSCYYLGFLFTIASIILSLYIIGVSNEEFNAADLAIRFAAAMVTTLLGMAIRVYLVTFAKRQVIQEKNLATDSLIKGDEPPSGSSQEIYIEAHLKNLEKLNKSLVLNIDATEKLRVNLVDLGARITSDIEVNSKAFQTFTEEMIKQSQLTMQNHQVLFQETMGTCLLSTKEQLSAMIADSTVRTQQYIDDTLLKVNSSALNSMEQVEKVSQNTIQKVDEIVQNTINKIDTTTRHSLESISQQNDNLASQLKQNLESINKAMELFVSKISSETLPTQEWQESLQKISLELNSVVGNFSNKISAFVNSMGDAQDKVQDYEQVLISSTHSLKHELENVVSSIRENTNDAKQVSSEMVSSVQSKVNNLEMKLNEISQLSHQISDHVQDLNHTVQVRSESLNRNKKGLFSRFFSKEREK